MSLILTGVKLVRIQYETGDNIFKTTIAVEKPDDVLSVLRENLKTPFRITSSEDLGVLNAMSDGIVNVIVKAKSPKPAEVPQPKRRRGGPRRKTE
jgi:hypothetical protein